MIRIGCWAAVLALIGATEDQSPVVSVPSGDYQIAWLELDGAWKEKDPVTVPLFLGLRGGEVASAWFCHPATSGSLNFWIDESTARLASGRFVGSVQGRVNGNGFGAGKVTRDFRYGFEVEVRDGKAAGRFEATLGAGKDRTVLEGPVRGVVESAEAMARRLALPPGADWPHYFGAGSAYRGPRSDILWIDDLSKARPLWKSEARILTGYGDGPDARYPDRAGFNGLTGGSSSPVISDGRLFQFYYRPSGPLGLYRGEGPGKHWKDEAELQEKAEKLFPDRPRAQRDFTDFYRSSADEVVVCMEASTGQTLWQTVLPRRGKNNQTHKHRGAFPVPLVAGDVLYVAGTAGRVYALDVREGTRIWEFPEADPAPLDIGAKEQLALNCRAPSPVLCGGTLAVAVDRRLVGLDAKTGRKAWSVDGSFGGALLLWAGDGASRLLALRTDPAAKKTFLVGVDPSTGKVAFQAETPIFFNHSFPILDGDQLFGPSIAPADGAKGTDDGDATLHCLKIRPDGVEPLWSAPGPDPVIDTVGLTVLGDHVYMTGARELFCFERATGNVVARVKEAGGARTQLLFSAAGRLFIQPEGRHGRQSFLMVAADPADLRVLPASAAGEAGHRLPGLWVPPHPHTTAYANQPIAYPLVDGRLFVRGRDGIYCYDLRR